MSEPVTAILVQIREQQKITNSLLADLLRAADRLSARTEFASILRGLRARGTITDADIARLDGSATADPLSPHL
jgi:hypothetical protein